ncbi:F-box protein [Aspergillus puulaauensis]|uniref:F-box domain-containing protein n=1 Tax=Aspergillus puulaauensis TaxID=1220207 RepID=A0A7R7XIK0_9EURO|nr:uncharacterized protein APUU_30187S [Aspergillus puulaauensis]BCS21962.1 hypothetical protein APUU_30187S [Aspergillus puulaauensis]
MSTLDNLPEELLALVLQNCDTFSQLRSLVLTSKRLHNTWICNQRAILWNVSQRAMVSFSDALIAVRATRIATDYFLNGQLPPDPFPVSELSGDTAKPCINEVKHALEFAHLAQYLEDKTRSPLGKRKEFLPDKWYFDSLAWTPRTWQVWRENYHRAVYRYLAAGAVLCRAYYAPLVSEKRPAGFLSSLLSILEGIAVQSDREYPEWFTEDEQRYLSTIPLYDSQAYANWESAFKPLEELFVGESKKQSQDLGPVTPPQPTEDLSQCLHCIFGSKAKNLQSLDTAHANTLFQQTLHFLNLIDDDIRLLISLPGDTPMEPVDDAIKPPSTTAFLFGSFTPMNITIRQGQCQCKCITTSAFATPLLAPLSSKSVSTATTSQYLSFSNMHNYLKKVHDASSLPNCYGDPIRKTPPPIGFFTEYMMRKYFGLRFACTMFDSTREIRCAWYAFHQFGGVFTGFGPGAGPGPGPGPGPRLEDDEDEDVMYVGQDLLVSVDEPTPMPCYDEHAWYY